MRSPASRRPRYRRLYSRARSFKQSAASAALTFDQTPTPASTQRRLERRSQLYYYGDDDTTPLAVGAFGARALVYQVQHAILPAAMVGALLPPAIDASQMAAAGYVQHDNHWWAPSETVTVFGRVVLSADQFHRSVRQSSRTVVFDAHQLRRRKVINALNQAIVVVYDYRLAVAVEPHGRERQRRRSPPMTGSAGSATWRVPASRAKATRSPRRPFITTTRSPIGATLAHAESQRTFAKGWSTAPTVFETLGSTRTASAASCKPSSPPIPAPR